FEVAGWTAFFRDKFAGTPVKPVAIAVDGAAARQGEFVVTASGVEGSLIYALSAAIREQIDNAGRAVIHLDLLPNRSREQVAAALNKPRGSRSLARHLAGLGIDGV